jgi:hypothetical protein
MGSNSGKTAPKSPKPATLRPITPDHRKIIDLILVALKSLIDIRAASP